jgi:hypothetical protein
MGIEIPPVVGDPGGMRALGDQLRATAGQLTNFEAELASIDKGMDFEGPAADEFAARMQSFGKRLAAVGARLEALASRLYAAAEEVERQIRERERLLEELRRAQAMAVGGS